MRPMPRDPPVTRAVLPEMENRSVMGGDGSCPRRGAPSPCLTGGAPRGATSVEVAVAQLGAAAAAGQAPAAVAVEVELVRARVAVDRAVVAQPGAAVVEALGEHGSHGVAQ